MRLPLCALSSLALALCLGPVASAQEVTPRFVQHPDVRGEKVVFTWEGDLWLGSLAGGSARRLTSHPGQETAAHFSPDGKWIAFSASYDGGTNVYLMPAEGGAPKRLTWRGTTQVLGWTPDSKQVLFRAAVDMDHRPIARLFTVDLDGHEPTPLPLPKGAQGTFSADGTQLLYNPKGNEEYYWKRYKGGQFAEIWLADLKAKHYTKLTDYVGKNAHPMWTATGQALFVSDRDNGVSNIYSLDIATKAAKPLTTYTDFDVQWPSTDGKTVVFAQGGFLTAFDVATGQAKRVDVKVASDSWKTAPRTVNPKDWIQSASLASGGKSLTLEARGEAFLLPTDLNQPALNLTKTPGVRERFPRLSPDGKRVAYFSDESGEYDLYLRPSEGGTTVRVPTGLKTTLYRLEWSPDSKKVLFSDKSFALYVMDVDTKKLEKIDSSNVLKNDQFTWEGSDYTWAPDSTWVAYTFVGDNRNSRVFLYNLATKQKVALTDGFFDCLNPAFDADGSTLYFLSYSNYEVRLDATQDNHVLPSPAQVMAVKLRSGEAKNSSSLSNSQAFQIETEGLAQRITQLPVKGANAFHLKAGKGLVGWSTVEGWDDSVNEEVYRARGQAKWTLHLYDPATKKETVLAEPISEWSFDPSGAHLLIKKGTDFHVGAAQQVIASKALPERVSLDRLSMTVDPKAEWAQIFQDTWRWYRDFFYDANMHGQDWNAIGAKFRAWVPQCTSRADLNWLLSQMVGELCASHTYVGGGDNGPGTAPPAAAFTGLLGADLAVVNGHYAFTRIYGPTPYQPGLKAPLADPTPKVNVGEYLLAIDGIPVKAPESPYRLLQIGRGQKVRLTVNGKPTLEGARTFEVEPVGNDFNLRYEGWIADRIKRVEARSNGRLGYMHMTAMGDQNIGQFDKYWRAFRYREGMVIDVRGNGGGWTEFFMIDKLERQQVGFNVLRGMTPFRYPGTASDGRYTFICNELDGSDGEAFLEHVKARKLGTIVGVPTWGGLVGIINTQFTMDGGQVEQSNNAFYGRDGKWWVENHGVDPDITVENDPESVLAAQDRQLDTAIDTLLKQLKDNPTPAFPAIPAYPKK
ncbi:MAG: PD40 domain-containing protein [Holophaga sp.]|nr:PD40 domain-containing protein [Holophaga sp.]